ncbi:MAG: radical SAM protein [bacterium]
MPTACPRRASARERDALLTFEEIERFVAIMAVRGVRRIRITGGEPLVRKGVVELIRRIAQTPGIEQVALTTNGHLLDRLAAPLFAAGLRGLNVSIDTFDPTASRPSPAAATRPPCWGASPRPRRRASPTCASTPWPPEA